MILVSGATGNVGGELVRQLVGAGVPVREQHVGQLGGRCRPQRLGIAVTDADTDFVDLAAQGGEDDHRDRAPPVLGTPPPTSGSMPPTCGPGSTSTPLATGSLPV
jgi:hypothetical protein